MTVVNDMATLERWKELADQREKNGEPYYVWLVGKAPEPLKGLPQKYVVRKMHTVSLAMYESKHSYTLDKAKDIAKNCEDFEMCKNDRLVPKDCVIEHCGLIGAGLGGYARTLLSYISESTGQNII